MNVASLRIHNERGLGRGFWFRALRDTVSLKSGINWETNRIFQVCMELTNFMFGTLIKTASAEFHQKALNAGYEA